MKFNLSILALAGLILGFTLQASACPHSVNQFICPGDKIVSDDNIVGTVVGVNPYQGTIVFKSDYSGNTFTRNKSTLGIGLGCLEIFCVGDGIVSNDNIYAHILAVNPYNNTISFRSDYSGNVFTRALQSLALGFGCVLGICVEDTVISSDNITATVLAVNPFNGEVAFRSNYSGRVFTRQAETLATSKYCDTYGEYPRRHKRFPFVNEASYIDIHFKWNLKRPIRP